MKSTANRALVGIGGILLLAWGMAQPQTTVRMEAEDMQLDTYRIELLDFASNGALINLKGEGFVGTATAPFPGIGGEYDISVVYHDENDGLAQLTVSINDREVDSWTLDERIKGGEQPIEANRFTREIATGYAVATGDEITINGLQGNWDHANVDYIEFEPSVPPIVDVQTEVQQLLAGDARPLDDFGSSVAIDGDTAVISASSESDGDTFNNGAAYVFTRSDGVWVEQAKLLASDKATNDRFGWSVALAGDTIVIGAPRQGDIGMSKNGAAYVFVRSDGVWEEQAKLLASDRSDGDRFGHNVAVQGDTAIIDPERKDEVYVFTRSEGAWSEQAKIPKDGSSVAIDGNTAIIGVTAEEDWSGAAYVFTRWSGVWVEQARLVASDKASRDEFGNSVAIDGDTVVIGARFSDDSGTDANGAAYVFLRSGGVWSEQAKLLASDKASFDWFGSSVAIDGDTAVIGAMHSGTGGKGAAYVFSRSGSLWTQRVKLLPSDIASQESYYGFGGSVSVDGRTAIVSGEADTYVMEKDSVPGYVFSLDDDSQVKIDIAPFAEPDEPNSVRLPPPLQRADVLVLSTNIADGEPVDFDATQVDPATTRFGPDEATAILRYVSIIDGDSDGDQDLFLKFNTYWTGIRCGDTDATLTGKTYAGDSFTGTDSVRPYPCP